MKLALRSILAALVLSLVACQPTSLSGSTQAGDPRSEALEAAAGKAGGAVRSVDPDGVPRLVVDLSRTPAPHGSSPEQAARFHLLRFAPAYEVDPSRVGAAQRVRARALGGGRQLVQFRQSVEGVELYRSSVKVLLTGDGALAAINGRLRPLPSQRPAPFVLSAEEATARALAENTGLALRASDLASVSAGGAALSRFSLAPHPAVHLSDGAWSRRVYFPESERLVPAYEVEFFVSLPESSDSEAFRYLIAADDGRVLEEAELTVSEAFTYRAWATPDLRPMDGPQADYSPHPTGVPDDSVPAFVGPSLVTLEGFNSLADPWLAAGATESSGNNVDAYTDAVAPDGFTAGSDLRATTTSPGSFDRTYDTAMDPLANDAQKLAAVTQAFYVSNWLHDWYYDSGFTEEAGNAQADNYGRGGAANDAMRVEVQDTAATARNNANMSTPGDGTAPRMQIYLWSGREDRYLRLSPPGEDVPTGVAAFGPQSFDLTGAVVAATDTGGASPTDGCEPISGVSGQLALVDRGNCEFKEKALNAQAAGALGLIIADNVAGLSPPGMADGSAGPVSIPTVSITRANGAALRSQLASGAVTGRLVRSAGPLRDGALDSTVVAHEWGHYLHHRLVAGCGNRQCGAISEGWGDYVALHLVVREGDALSGTFSIAGYSAGSFLDGSYYGIRRYPYSLNLARNPLTFRHIGDGAALPSDVPNGSPGVPNSEVHAAGEVWAQMMWEVYAALLQNRGARSFDQVRREITDDVVAALELTPPDATFTEQRDAVLTAIAARSQADALVAAQAFARRGAGSCALSPSRTSTNLTGVVEDFDLAPNLVLGAVTLDDSIRPCDGDGVLDGAETGLLRITLLNSGHAAASGSILTVGSTSSGVSFPAGTSVFVPTIPALSSQVVTVQVRLDSLVSGLPQLAFNLSVANGAACVSPVSSASSQSVNFNELLASTATDAVDSPSTTWSARGSVADKVWRRVPFTHRGRVWQGTALGLRSDTWLESPDLQVSASGSLGLSFFHRHQFESDPGTHWDGAVLEFSSDSGATWLDLSTLVSPGYGGTITDESGNPLGGRQGFVSQSSAWPLMQQVTLNLGTSLAGETIRVRFRLGTDAAVGDLGWEIDQIAFTGLTNTPFSQVVEDTNRCEPACAGGLADCSGVCANLALDETHCGTCGNSCASGNECVDGTCQFVPGSCGAMADCGGACRDLTSDEANCGACGNVCAAGSSCLASECQTAPVANAGADQSVVEGAEATLDGSASSDAEGDPLTFAWLQTEGPPVVLSSASASSTTFTAPDVDAETALTFRLTVRDGQAPSTDEVTVTVTPRGCGCGSGASGAAPLFGLLLLALRGLRRRRQLA